MTGEQPKSERVAGTRVISRAGAILAGVGGGLLSGLVGGGGGAVMVPIMTGVLKMGQHIAHGTSLVVIVGTALAAALTYSLREAIDWPLVLALVAGSGVGAFAGATLSQRIPALRLRQIFGLFLILVAARLLFFRTIDPLIAAEGWTELVAGSGIGLLGGLLSGALGVGGGAIFVPALVLLIGIEQHEAQGISLWVVVCSSIVGASTHYRLGTVDMRVARWVAPAAVPAGIAGALLATQLDASQLQSVFSVILVGLGLQTALSATRRMRDTQAP